MTVRVDFGVLGDNYYPGSLAVGWGTFLVEPPSIGALRKAAGSLLAPLGSIAPVRSGIATRVVNYFMVQEQSDETLLAEFGIRSARDRERLALVRDGRDQLHLLEREVLKPVVRRPGALEGRIRVSEDAAVPWKMLYTSATKEELAHDRRANTLAYLEYGETTDFPAREGSRRNGGIPAFRPQVRVRRVWFHVPRIETGPGRLCWLKGRGDRHYVPVLDEHLLVPDNFLYSAPPENLSNPHALAASANLSWTHLMSEVFGRRAGGDGVLHTYIRELNRLPLVDPRRLTAMQADDLVGLFEAVASRPVLNIDAELREPDRQAFDLWAMRYLFGDEAESAAATVERALRDLAAERTTRIVSGREQERRAAQRSAFDPAPIAARILQDVGTPPVVLSRFANLDLFAMTSVVIEIPPHNREQPVLLGETLFDADAVVVEGHVIPTPSATHAALLVAACRTQGDVVGSVVLPRLVSDAEDALRTAESEWKTWEAAVADAVVGMLPGPQRAMRREQVRREVERQGNLAHAVINMG